MKPMPHGILPADDKPPPANEVRGPRLFCVGGGKGGTGKSILALNLANRLAGEGLQVVLADLDLGGANLHILSGHRRCSATLRDFFGGQVDDIGQLLVRLDQLGVFLLPGGDEVAGVVQPGFQRKQKLIRHLHKLDADVIVCDLGGNSGLDTLDFFNEADWGLVVTTPEPTAIQNAYGFIKAALFRKVRRKCPPGTRSRRLFDRLWDPSKDAVAMTVGEFIRRTRDEDFSTAELIEDVVRSSRFYVIVNMARPDEGERVFKALADVVWKFLDLKMFFLGQATPEDRIHQAVVKGLAPLLGESLLTSTVWARLVRRMVVQAVLSGRIEVPLFGSLASCAPARTAGNR